MLPTLTCIELFLEANLFAMLSSYDHIFLLFNSTDIILECPWITGGKLGNLILSMIQRHFVVVFILLKLKHVQTSSRIR